MPIRIVFPTENLEKSSKNQPILLFHKSSCIFSNFFPANFSLETGGKRREFNCNEQFFMYQKALSIGDSESGEAILKMTKPLLMKRAGRRLKMDQETLQRWSESSSDVMHRGITAKFAQNEQLLLNLFRSRGMLLAEASPRDKLWGIGLGVNNKLAESQKTWKGTNKLGKILENVRDALWEDVEFLKFREIVEQESVAKRCEKLRKTG